MLHLLHLLRLLLLRGGGRYTLHHPRLQLLHLRFVRRSQAHLLLRVGSSLLHHNASRCVSIATLLSCRPGAGGERRELVGQPAVSGGAIAAGFRTWSNLVLQDAPSSVAERYIASKWLAERRAKARSVVKRPCHLTPCTHAATRSAVHSSPTSPRDVEPEPDRTPERPPRLPCEDMPPPAVSGSSELLCGAIDGY